MKREMDFLARPQERDSNHQRGIAADDVRIGTARTEEKKLFALQCKGKGKGKETVPSFDIPFVSWNWHTPTESGTIVAQCIKRIQAISVPLDPHKHED